MTPYSKIGLIDSGIAETVSYVQEKRVPIKVVGDVELSVACNANTNGEAEKLTMK